MNLDYTGQQRSGADEMGSGNQTQTAWTTTRRNVRKGGPHPAHTFFRAPLATAFNAPLADLLLNVRVRRQMHLKSNVPYDPLLSRLSPRGHGDHTPCNGPFVLWDSQVRLQYIQS